MGVPDHRGTLTRQGVRLGIITPVATQMPGAHAAWEASAGIKEMVAIAQAADRLGFDHLTCSEHVAVPPADAEVRGGVYWDPLATLGYIAGQTSRIRLATYVLVLGFHHPLEIAKRYGTLDRVAGGRLVLGVGVGTLEREFDLLGVPFADRGDRADDALRALRASMGRRDVEYHGTHYDYADLLVEPHALNPHVPFWIGGRTRRSLRRALELAEGWAPFWLKEPELASWLGRGRPAGRLRGGGPAPEGPRPERRPRRGGRAPGGLGSGGGDGGRPARDPPLARPLPRAAGGVGVVNPISVGFFSMSSAPLSGDEDGYLRWHLLDHLPEQYSIPGIRLATRWRADDACVAARLAASEALAPVRHAVGYFMTEPVGETLTAFARLGRRAAELGRYPEPATSHLLGAFHLQEGVAAPRVLVSGEALPFRPHRGVVLLVEAIGDGDVSAWARWHHIEHLPALLQAPGVAGAYVFRSSTLLGTGADQGERFGVPMWNPGQRFVTVVYVDDDLLSTARALEPLLRSRWDSGAVTPELAAPFRSMVTYEAWPEA